MFLALKNHANLPTKYHFEAPPIGEGVFRLFPSGTNAGYASGCEVFNSYGKRPNDNLLMEYGFGAFTYAYLSYFLSRTCTRSISLVHSIVKYVHCGCCC
jgi:hypothetical protein